MKPKPLEGQVAIVTGGGRGMGRAIALDLSARGARVVVMGPVERELGEVVGEIANAGGKARHVRGDVREAADVDAAVARAVEVFGGLDVAVANAGASDAGAELGAGAEARSRALDVFATDLRGAYLTFDSAAHAMKGPGRLVAVCRAPPDAGIAAAACRDGTLGLVRAAAALLAPRAITANAIVRAREDREPREIAELVAFLCSSAAAGMTGQAISI
jgi:3-oxoacyl-[acyl-carrier protein] reductase